MRLTALFLLVFCMHITARTVSQTVTLTGKNLSMKKVFAAIEQQTGHVVWGKVDFLQNAKPVSVAVKQMPLDEFLTKVLKNQPFTYTVSDKTIILSENNLTPDFSPPITISISGNKAVFVDIAGIVLNSETNEAIESATISVKGATWATRSDNTGSFSFTGVPLNAILTMSSVGYSNIEIPIENLLRMQSEQTLNIRGGTVRKIPNGIYIFSLAPVKVMLQEVLVNNGMFTRNKESFTGATSVFTGNELRAVGVKNVLQSLKTLDPSFVMLDDNLQGSNPNRLPKIEIRGRTTLTNANLNDQFNADPNQPLFILDGFETTLETIYNLDMNRVSTITLLKDAASTALYGAKAANGVVVVETKRPTPGKLQMSYVGDFSADLPDLTSYNLMNASERLQWEALTNGTLETSTNAWRVEERNAARLADVQRGVNTYWLHEPVQTGFTNKHSIQLNGGSNDLYFNAGAMYGKQNGVMKGSNKENWAGNMMATYRKGRLNITDMINFSGTTGNESPYGNFGIFAAANPYYRKTDENGVISRKIDPIYDTAVINPLYNASLFSINQSKAFSFANNLRAIYSVNNAWRVEGGLQLSKSSSRSIMFTPPDHTSFDGIESSKKGSYTNNTGEAHGYNANLSVGYGELIGRSQISVNIRGQVESNSRESVGFSLTGYPYGTNGNPAYSYGYTPFSIPRSSNITTRSTSFTGSVNYIFDSRFMIDGVYTLTGASAFGSNKRFQPFVSGGLGWNIHQEPILRDISWLNLLKIRGNAGFSGNQNLGSFTSVSTYSFQTVGSNYFGQGLALASLGSPNLEWSKTMQASFGIDFSMMNNRISGMVEFFRKVTDPLSVGAEGTLPSSVAVNNNYVINVGTLTTTGWNASLKYSPVYDLQNRIIWTISANAVKNTSLYEGFSNRLEALNKEEQASNGLNRYYDGYSPDDIWTVESLGIDPANGMELFRKIDGTVSYVYSPSDVVRVGNTRPELEGILNTSFTYKAFTFGASARYRLGGYIFNSALYNKVENIYGNNLSLLFSGTTPNLDRRALYDRWQNPGDVAQFTSVRLTGATPMSSRYVQKDNHFIGESFNLSWRTDAPWVKKLQLQSLNVNFYMNDIFRVESVLTERGLEYPFSRSASFSINASF